MMQEINEQAFELAYAGLVKNYIPELWRATARHIIADYLKYNTQPSSKTAQDVVWAYQRALKEVTA